MARRRMIEVSLAHDKDFGQLSEFAQLLYLKVLPHTDDYGRMDGDPATLKVRVDGFSKRKVDDYEKAMGEIAKAGLWLWFETPDHKKVVQFKPATFERINAFLIKSRTKAEYAEYKDSYVVIRGVMVPITHREYKDKEKEKDTAIWPDMPPELQKIPGFSDAWSEWLVYREKEIKVKVTPKAAKENFVWFLKQKDPVACIKQSMRHNWRGLFELKDEKASPRLQEPAPRQRSTYHCLKCDTDHPISAPCPPKTKVTPIVEGLSKRMDLPKGKTQ